MATRETKIKITGLKELGKSLSPHNPFFESNYPMFKKICPIHLSKIS